MNDMAGCYWLEKDVYEPGPSLRGDAKADVVIIGGGFTGLWTAYHLLRADPGMTIIVLERDVVGNAASGRNAGSCLPPGQRHRQALVEALGRERATAFQRGAEEAVNTIERVCAEEKIDAELMRCNTLTVSSTPIQDDHVRRDIELAQAIGTSVRFLERDEIQDRVHSETLRFGVEEGPYLLVNPTRLVRGLKEAVIRRGGQVFEHTPMEHLSQSKAGVTVRTPNGSVRAERGLLGVNAYGTRIPQLRGRVMPFYSYNLVSERLTDEQWERVGWKSRELVIDRRVFMLAYRPTIDGRILWGGRDAPYRPDSPDPRYERDDYIFRRLEESFRWTFPQLHDVRFEYGWGGPEGITGSFMPGAGWLPGQRVAYAFGYNGVGVSLTNLLAMSIRDLMLERDTQFSRLGVVGRMPPWLGPRFIRDPLVRAHTGYQLRQDDAGRALKPPLLVRLTQRLFGS